MILAVDIKRRFPDLQVFDHDELAFVKAVLYKDDVEMLEIRVEQKENNSTFADSEKEYWITTRIISIPDLPELPKVRNEGTEVVNTKGDLFKNIEAMLSYARAV
jgi:hypothetical protein